MAFIELQGKRHERDIERLKWHRYEPAPQVHSLETFVHVVERDEHDCFFG